MKFRREALLQELEGQLVANSHGVYAVALQSEAASAPGVEYGGADSVFRLVQVDHCAGAQQTVTLDWRPRRLVRHVVQRRIALRELIDQHGRR